MKSKKYILAFLVLFFAFFGFSPVFSADLKYKLLEGIPGVFPAGTAGINLNDYITGLYNFLIWAAGISALIMITAGGYMYLTSAANAAGASKAKAYITDALLGLGLVFASWLILNIINPNLTSPVGFETTIVSSVSPNILADTPSSGTISGNANLVSEAEARRRLSAVGISVNRECHGIDTPGSTCLDGIPEGALNRLIEINRNVPIIVTGGTERAGHSSHAPGLDRTDIKPKNFSDDNEWKKLGSFIKKNVAPLGITQICTAPQDRAYTYGKFYEEKSRHFHISGKYSVK